MKMSLINPFHWRLRVKSALTVLTGPWFEVLRKEHYLISLQGLVRFLTTLNFQPVLCQCSHTLRNRAFKSKNFEPKHGKDCQPQSKAFAKTMKSPSPQKYFFFSEHGEIPPPNGIKTSFSENYYFFPIITGLTSDYFDVIVAFFRGS